MAEALSTAEAKPTSPTTTTASNKQKTTKFYSHFVFRASVAAIFLVIIPMLPSLAPADSFTHSFSTQSWELLQMILVGIAVSYGLFSRRYDDSGGDDHNNHSKSENAHESYVSRLLQVTSVFDDEVTGHHPSSSSSSGSGGGSIDNDEAAGLHRVQAWSSRYYRNEPPSMVILPNRSAADVGDEEMRQLQQQQQLLLTSSSNNTVIRDDGKPLLLPIRSLKSRISDELGDGDRSSFRRSKSSSSASNSDDGSRKNGNETSRSRVPDVAAGSFVNGDLDGDYVEVSRAFSRSNTKNLSSGNSTDDSSSKGRRNGVLGERGLDEGNLNNARVEEEISVVLPSPIPWRSRSGKRGLMPALEVNPNSNSNNNKTSHSSSARSSTSSSSGSSTPTGGSPIKPHSKPSVLESHTRRTGDKSMRRKSFDNSSPPRSPKPPLGALSPVRVLASGDHQVSSARNQKHVSTRRKRTGLMLDEQEENSSSRGDYQPERMELRTGPDSTIVKSVRTIRGGDESSSATTEMRMAGRPDDGFVHTNTDDFLEQVLVATDDDDSEEEEESESESDGMVGDQVRNAMSDQSVSIVPASSSSGDHVGDDGPDVDKKADEFIAKFREQIRLQRIESIKKSSGQLSRKS